MLQLTIQNINNNKLAQKFLITWVLPTLKKSLKYRIKQVVKPRLDNYPEFVTIKNLVEAIDTLYVRFTASKSNAIICFDSNKIASKSSAKLYDICALVNYGSLEYPSCPIFTSAFIFFEQNINKLFNLYRRGLLPPCQ